MTDKPAPSQATASDNVPICRTNRCIRLSRFETASVAVNLAQPGAGAQDQLESFEFIEPVLRDGVQQRIALRDQSRRTGGTKFISDHFPVLRQRAIAIPPDLAIVFA